MKYKLFRRNEDNVRYVLNTKTGESVFENIDPVKYQELRKKAISAANRAAKDQAMRDCGLTKVRGAVSGRTYWE